MSRTSALAAALVLAGALASAASRADGAFPDELQVLAPPDFPHRVVLGTNFGVLVSDDDGQRFDFVCEGHISTQLVLAYGSVPGGEMFAISGPQLHRSLDEGCTWSPSSGGTDATRGISDAFADPTDAGRVAALAVGPVGGPLSQLFVSNDRGATFGSSVYDEENGNLIGVEYATSESGTLYITGARLPPDGGSRLPFVRAWLDGGWSEWTHPELAGTFPYLAAVDSEDAAELYLRIVQPSGSDQLAVSTDRGATLQVALDLGEAMSAFARGSDGTLYVGARSGSLWVEAAGSTLWVKNPSPKLRCLAERSGTLYGCGDSASDGYALGVSTDHGATWAPLLRYGDIRGLLACPGVQTDCAAALTALRIQFPPSGPDGGAVDAGPVTAPPDAGSDAHPTSHAGCGCAGTGSSFGLGWLGLAAVIRARGRR